MDNEKYLIFYINGKEYIKTKIVCLGERAFQEYSCIDIDAPSIVYIEEQTNQIVQDYDTYIALREKYAIDKEFLRTGRLILNGGFSEKEEQHFLEVSQTNEQVNAEETKEVQKFFEQDLTEICERISKKYAHIFKKHGIENPKKWIEEKLRRYGDNPYHVDGSINNQGQCHYDGKIVFSSLEVAKSKYVRNHENIHNLTKGDNGYGISVMKKEIIQGKTVYIGNGTSLNEGGTDYLTDEKDVVYEAETFIVKEIIKIVSEDVFVEAMLFNDPQMLADKFNEKVGDKSAYHKLMTSLDDYALLQKWLHDVVAKGNENKFVEAWNITQAKLYEAHECLRDATINQIKKSKGIAESVKAEINFWRYVGSNLAKLPLLKMYCPMEKKVYNNNVIKAIKERIAAISLFKGKDKDDDKSIEPF